MAAAATGCIASRSTWCPDGAGDCRADATSLQLTDPALATALS